MEINYKSEDYMCKTPCPNKQKHNKKLIYVGSLTCEHECQYFDGLNIKTNTVKCNYKGS